MVRKTQNEIEDALWDSVKDQFGDAWWKLKDMLFDHFRYEFLQSFRGDFWSVIRSDHIQYPRDKDI